MISQYAGRTITPETINGHTVYLVTDTGGGSFTVGPLTGDPLFTIDAHAPGWWTPPAPPPVTTIAPLAMMARLTAAEQSALATAAQSNAQVMLWMVKMAQATVIDTTDPLTVAGVQAMEAAGLLATGRAAVILDLSQPSP